MEYFEILLWAAWMALACVGFGKEALRWMGCRNGGWALASVLGVSILIALGGFLNLAHLIRPSILIGIIVLGNLLLIYRVRESFHAVHLRVQSFLAQLHPRWLASIGLLLLLLILGRAALSSYTGNFNETDDFDAYFAFPLKMLAKGNFAADPFSERRVTASLGGSVYLQAIALSVNNDLRAINVPDGTLGLLLFAVVCFSLCRLARLNIRQILCVFTIFALTPEYRVNSTFVVLPAALVMGCFLIVLTREFGSAVSLRRYFTLGLAVAGICTLKSTMIPGISLICAALLAFEFFRASISQAFRAAAAFGTAICVGMGPWMIDSKIKSGTALYPILGRGYDFTAYSSLPHVPPGALPALAIKTGIVSIPYLLMVVFILLYPRKLPHAYRTVTLAVLLGTGLGTMALSYATQGDSILRYSITIMWPANIFLAIVLFATLSESERAPRKLSAWMRPISAVWVAWALVFALMAGIANGAYGSWKTACASLLHSKPLWAPGEREEAAALQATIPVGAPLLTHMTHAYTADFNRNPILIADFPGMASLPPGLPVGQGPEALARYLVQHSVRYVAYSYYDQAGFPHAYFDSKIKSWIQRPWAREQVITTLDFQDNISTLAKTRRHLFDDGRVYVLDLMDSSPVERQ